MNQHPDNGSPPPNPETAARAPRGISAYSEQENNERRTVLPEDVRNLIVRRLNHKRGEHQRLWRDTQVSIYSKLRKKILECLSLGQTGRTFITIPLEVYGELVSNARAVTNEWPSVVWETIRTTLQNVNVITGDGVELNAIVDEFSWSIEGSPFTLDYIAPTRFLKTTKMEARHYGGMRSDTRAEFERLLALKAGAAESGIRNWGRAARENVGIAIDEYLVAAEQSPSARTPNTTRRAKKQSTLATDANPNDPPVGSAEWRRSNARTAANARHSQRGGSRDKQQRMRKIWAKGKYSSRDRCAEKECEALGMSFKAARNALINIPRPKKPPRC